MTGGTLLLSLSSAMQRELYRVGRGRTVRDPALWCIRMKRKLDILNPWLVDSRQQPKLLVKITLHKNILLSFRKIKVLSSF